MTARHPDRVFIRSHVSAPIKLSHPRLGELMLNVDDISDGGAFISLENSDGFAMNDEVSVQIIAFGDKAPVPVPMRVVRITPEGVGLAYI